MDSFYYVWGEGLGKPHNTCKLHCICPSILQYCNMIALQEQAI